MISLLCTCICIKSHVFFLMTFQFIKRHDLDIPEELIEGTIHCKEGAAPALCENIYELLTNRKWVSTRCVCDCCTVMLSDQELHGRNKSIICAHICVGSFLIERKGVVLEKKISLFCFIRKKVCFENLKFHFSSLSSIYM